MSPALEDALAQVIEHHGRHGEVPALEPLAGADAGLLQALRIAVERFLRLEASLDEGAPPPEDPAPTFEGYRTIERLGQGGMGAVYKLQDLTLGRFVAAKVVPRPAGAPLETFLAEARSLALFSDERIVQVYDCRIELDRTVIFMEYVDGFELGKVGPSLELRQKVGIVREVCHTLEHAHGLGLQHRDLKPSNIMLDSRLRPKLVDFGLAGTDPTRGHFRGTPQYLAPEQLDGAQHIDGRTDVYAMGVVLYDMSF